MTELSFACMEACVVAHDGPPKGYTLSYHTWLALQLCVFDGADEECRATAQSSGSWG